MITLELNQCPICGIAFSTGKVLHNTKIGEEIQAMTGTSLCPTHQKLYNDDYIALVEVTNDDQSMHELNYYEAQRTGIVAHIQRERYEQLFGPIEKGNELENQFVFVQKGIIQALKKDQ